MGFALAAARPGTPRLDAQVGLRGCAGPRPAHVDSVVFFIMEKTGGGGDPATCPSFAGLSACSRVALGSPSGAPGHYSELPGSAARFRALSSMRR
jgi:hypothetical protein